MIEFVRNTSIEKHKIEFKHILRPSVNDFDHQIPDRSRIDTQYISVNIPPEHLPLHLDIETFDSTAVAPFQIRNIKEDDLETELPIKIQAPPDDSLDFRLMVSKGPFGDAQRIQSLQVSAPPLRAFELTYEILSRRYDESTFDRLTARTSADFKPKIAVEFIEEMREYLSVHQYFRLLNILIENYTDEWDFFEELDTMFFGETLPGTSSNNSFEITSAARLRQYCATANQLPSVPKFEEKELIKAVLQNIDERMESDIKNTLNSLLNLNQMLDIHMEYSQCFHDRHYLGVISALVFQNRYYEIRNVMKQWNEASSIDPINDLKVNEKYYQDFLNNVARAINRTLKNKIVNFNYAIPGYRAVAELYEEVGKQNHARTAWFFHHRLYGVYYQNKNNYDAACSEFKQARAYSLNELEEHGEDRFTNFSRVWIDLFKARLEKHQSHGNYGKAVEVLKDGINATETDSFSELIDASAEEWVKVRMKALLHEAKGDQYLNNHQRPKAKKFYGKAIGNLNDYEERHKMDIIYLENRRSAIEAAMREAEGEYQEAARKYEEILSRTKNTNLFTKFHQARGKLCRVKESIVNRDVSNAKDRLADLEYEGGILGNELEYVDLFLDVLDDYERGTTTNITTVLNRIEELPPLEPDHVDLDFGYGHDYRPAFVNLLAAQRLKNIDVPEDIIDSLVDISLNEVLRPSELDHVLRREGLDKIQIDDQWKSRVPEFITRQLQEVEQNEIGKRSDENYRQEAKTLTGILEEFLEVVVAYYAISEYDDDWQSHIAPNSRVTLTTLSDFLRNEVFDNLSWANEVRDLLEETRFDSLVLPDKEGKIGDVRNDFAHNNISFVDDSQYYDLKEHIESIFVLVSREMPVLGKVGEENVYGAYSVQLLRAGISNEIEVMTSKEMTQGCIYYFPPTVLNPDAVPDIDENTIHRCEEEDILESIRSHTQIQFGDLEDDVLDR